MADPNLSIVIPTMSRPGIIERCFDHIAAATRSKPVEVIVVCDSRESDPGRIEREISAHRLEASLLVAKRAGASAARNLGWRHATGELILFVGDDILVDLETVERHIAFHREHPDPTEGLLGNVRWADELDATTFMRWLEDGIQFDFARIEGRDAGWGRFYTANASVKRSILERVDGFDEQALPFLYEDLDLALRMSKLGFELRYDPDAGAQHLHPADLEGWKGRVRILAPAERTFVAKHPGLAPYFHRLFSAADRASRARGRAAALTRIVGPSTPLLGPLAWNSAAMQFKQALAPEFLAAWREDEETRPDPYPVGSASRSGPGPK